MTPNTEPDFILGSLIPWMRRLDPGTPWGYSSPEGPTLGEHPLTHENREEDHVRIFGWMEAIIALGLLVVAPVRGRTRRRSPLKDVPRAVIDAVEAKFPDAKMKKAVKEEEDGRDGLRTVLHARGQGLRGRGEGRRNDRRRREADRRQ